MKMPTSPHQVFADEGDSHLHNLTANTRRVNKQVMERQRRARINNCLHQIKSIILEDTNKDPSQYQKLEKADILEMTVQYLSRCRSSNTVPASTSTPIAGPCTSKTVMEPRRHFQDVTNLNQPLTIKHRSLYSPSTTTPSSGPSVGCPVTFSSLVSSVVPVVVPKPFRPPVQSLLHTQQIRKSPAGHVSPDSQSVDGGYFVKSVSRPQPIWRPW